MDKKFKLTVGAKNSSLIFRVRRWMISKGYPPTQISTTTEGNTSFCFDSVDKDDDPFATVLIALSHYLKGTGLYIALESIHGEYHTLATTNANHNSLGMRTFYLEQPEFIELNKHCSNLYFLKGLLITAISIDKNNFNQNCNV